MTQPMPPTTMPPTMRAPGLLRAVFVVHGLITLAGAAVLTAFPTAIPSAVGISLERSDYLLVYLAAAAELAVAVASFGATLITDSAALRLIVTTIRRGRRCCTWQAASSTSCTWA